MNIEKAKLLIKAINVIDTPNNAEFIEELKKELINE